MSRSQEDKDKVLTYEEAREILESQGVEFYDE
jgi:hypothetical protein